jgi:multiple sugar transport system substrate-binding protein
VVVAAGAVFVLRPGGSPTPSPTASPSPTATPGPVTVRWFAVDYSSGSAAMPYQIEWIRDFNERQSEIVLKLELVPSDMVLDHLKTEISLGNAPDIVGPLGQKTRDGFEGLFLDLNPLMESHGFEKGNYDPALFRLLSEGDAQVGIPYLIFPAFMFYNKDLFVKADLPDLPKHVGETYMGKTWDWNEVKAIGQKLTLDKNGKNATQAGFDPNNIVQFGIDFQWWDGRRMASAFGAGSFVAEDGRTAQIPPTFADAWRWYYDAIWTSHFAPSATYMHSTLLNNGMTVSSGRIAMAAANGWSINSYGTAGKATFKAWDMAVMPSWKGQTSGPIDADSFVLAKAGKHPDEAFEVITTIMQDQGLMQVYGGMPADKRLQPAYFAAFDTQLEAIFPGNEVSWQVLDEMSGYPAIPSHEANMPNFLQATADYSAFFTKLQASPGLDFDEELVHLQIKLQADFDYLGVVEY